MAKKILLGIIIALTSFVVVSVVILIMAGSDGRQNIFSRFFGGNLPDRINILLIGTDVPSGANAVGRADMISIISINTKDETISLIAIPRDTRIVVPAYRLEILRENGRNTARSSGVMRLNELTHHAGPSFGFAFTKLQIEELIGITIDYYVHINLEGFRFIVDEIGGIEFNVPMRMFYSDPHQNLLIDLQPGMQVLNGEMAEGLVRFRSGYGDQDLGRMRMQHQFMMAAMTQIINKDNIVRNFISYLNVFINHVDTNFDLLNAPRYLSLLGSIDFDNVATYTLPGRGQIIDGRYYHILDETAVELLIKEILGN